MEGTARAIRMKPGEMVHHSSMFCFSTNFQCVGALKERRLRA